MRQPFLSIPREIEEAALMVGCRWWQVVFRVLIPMSLLISLLPLLRGEGAKKLLQPALLVGVVQMAADMQPQFWMNIGDKGITG